MMKLLKKLLAALIVPLLLLSGSLMLTSAAEEEALKINGIPVNYLFTSTPVTIPKNYVTNEREMRGVWVATVFNIDVAKQAGTSEKAINNYKAQYLAILDRMEFYKMNTIFFQIRPSNDAFYPSELNPWSEFLAGHGVNPGWDPLAWMIEVTHARGIEFQCWMNAYRITPGVILPSGEVASKYTDAELIQKKHARLNGLNNLSFAKQHPEYVLLGETDTKLILNPGEVAVQQFIVDTIMEIVENYDVDGLHFDDYFYLSGQTGSNPQTTNRNFAGGSRVINGVDTLNDLGTYQRYQANPSAFSLPAGLNLGDFRRESINNMMASIRSAIDQYNLANNKYVEFGSKPAAVWRSNSEHCYGNERTSPDGSNTHCYAYSSYYDLFADTKKWVEEGYVDYIAPQVYYDFANTEVPYADIVTWWADVVTETNEKRALNNEKPIKMYVAHGIYLIDDSTTRFNDEYEMVYQLKYNQKFDCIKGSAVFAYNDLAGSSPLQASVMNHFRGIWNRNVLKFTKGDYDAGGLAYDQIEITGRESTGRLSISLNNVEGIAEYAFYEIAEGEALEFNPKQRRAIINARGDSITHEFTKKEGARYYLQAVSKNNHLSEIIIEIIFTEASFNTPPKLGEIIFNEGNPNALIGVPIKITLNEAIDDEGDSLTYRFDISTDGIDGNYRYELKNYTIENGVISLIWDSYFVETDGACVRVIVSDGEYEVIGYSNVIRLYNEQVDPDPDPDPEPDQKEPIKTGCNFGLMWYEIMTFTSLVVVLMLRKRK